MSDLGVNIAATGAFVCGLLVANHIFWGFLVGLVVVAVGIYIEKSAVLRLEEMVKASSTSEQKGA